jgi:hypothetical protein
VKFVIKFKFLDLNNKQKPRIMDKVGSSCFKTLQRHIHSTPVLAKIVPNNLKGKSKSSQEWLTRQFADPFVEKAKMMNYR